MFSLLMLEDIHDYIEVVYLAKFCMVNFSYKIWS
jgi:hypothetical protein